VESGPPANGRAQRALGAASVAARTVAEALADLANGSAPVPGSAGAPFLEIPGRARRTSSKWRDCSRPGAGDPVRIEGASDPAHNVWFRRLNLPLETSRV
jgi:hypothetical protein